MAQAARLETDMKYLIAILFTTVIGACSSFPRIPLPTRDVPVPVVLEVYPELPPMQASDLELSPTIFDIPRITAMEKVVRNDPDCQSVPEEERNDIFWDECGEYRQDKYSNLFVGFDRENYENYVLNLARIAEFKKSIESLIEAENARRAEWSRLNEESKLNIETLEAEMNEAENE